MNNKVKEELKKYGFGVALFSLLILHMFYTLWTNEAWLLFHAVADATFLPDGAAGTKLLVLFASGVYFGLLFIYSLDHRKRYRGLILLIGSVIIISGLALAGYGIPNFELSVSNLGAFLIGLIIGVITEFSPFEAPIIDDTLRSVDWDSTFLGSDGFHWGPAREKTSSALIEFNSATRILQGYTLLLVGTGAVANVLIARPDIGVIHIIHLVGSIVFIYFLLTFLDIDVTSSPDISDTSYTSDDSTMTDSTHTFEFAGPVGSGKTYLAFGLFSEVPNIAELQPDGASPELRDLYYTTHQNIDKQLREQGYVEWDVVESTDKDEMFDYWFEFEVQGVKQRTARIEQTDYGGELLDKISNLLENRATRADGGRSDPDHSGDPSDGDSDEGVTITEDDYHRDDSHVEEPESLPNENHSNESTKTTDSTDSTDGSEEAWDFSGGEQGSGNTVPSHADQLSPIDDEYTPDPGSTQDTSSESDSDASDSVPNRSDNESQAEYLSEDEIAKNVADSMQNADSLIFVIDGKRILRKQVEGPDTQHIEADNMASIATATAPEYMIPVVTKADCLISDFKKHIKKEYIENEEKDADDLPDELVPTEDHLWDEYRTYLTNRLKNDPRTQQFMAHIDDRKVLPVYYHSKRMANGQTESRSENQSTDATDPIRDHSPDHKTQDDRESPLQADSSYHQGEQEVPDISSEKDFKREGFATLLKELSKEL